MTKRPTLFWTWACCALALASAACSVDEPTLEPERAAVRAIWDPTTSTLPTPTDLARDPTTGRLALPIDAEVMPAAEQEWRAWLNTLDGYPASSTLAIPVSGPLDEASLPGAVVLVREDTGERVRLDVAFDAERLEVVAAPIDDAGAPALLAPGASYAFGLWGYEGGARGAEGEPLVADAAFYFARADASLEDHPRALPGATQAERDEAIASLEEVRLAYQPLYDALAPFGITRGELAVAANFSTRSGATLWFDSTTGRVPLPNALLIDAQTDLVTLPIDEEEDDEEARHIKEALSQYDGFSTTGAITIEASEPVDRASALDPANVRVFRLGEDGELIEHTDLERGVLDDGVTVWVRPSLAFEPATTYVYVVDRGLRTEQGASFEAQPLSALLRMESPLVVDGASQIDSLDDETAALLEPARRDVKRVLDKLVASGTPRAQVSMAVPFRTVDTVGFLMDWRAKVYREAPRADVVDVLAQTPRERGLRILLPAVETVVTGKLTTLEHLDPVTLALREDGLYEERLVEFVLTIPESARPGEPIPTVVFGHGLSTSRELLYLIANKLARNGYAAISMDLALHGERSVCLRDSSCKDDATCNERRECVNPDGSPGQLVRVESPFPDGPSYPITSGEPFINLEDIEASRDHFIQAVMDLSQLIRVVRGADWAKATGGYVLDGGDVVYLGMSLGGILGSVFTVIEPTIETYVLNVPGAGLLEMVENSAAFSTLYADALEHRSIEVGTDDYFRFQNIIRWMLDPVDPVNVVQHAVQQPLRYVDPVDGEEKTLPLKRVMIQMAEGDSVVPNITTEILSARMGIDYRRYTPTISNHAFLFDPTSFEGGRARDDMIDFFEQR